jgi:hypothetical protein
LCSSIRAELLGRKRRWRSVASVELGQQIRESAVAPTSARAIRESAVAPSLRLRLVDTDDAARTRAVVRMRRRSCTVVVVATRTPIAASRVVVTVAIPSNPSG